MKKRVAIALLFATWSWTKSSASAAATEPTIAALSQRYLDGLFRAKPHLATFMGDHRFDDKVVDLSPERLAERERELGDLERDLRSATPRLETPDARIDAEILSDAVALELLYLREIRDWQWDPRLHDSFPYYDPREIVAARLEEIIHGSFAPEAERLHSVVAELEALPRLLGQETAALEHALAGRRHPAKVYAEQAVQDNLGRIAFFEGDVKQFTARSPAAEEARGRALAALRLYQHFLEVNLLPHADGDWRLGNALYQKKFPLALQTTQTPDEVVPRAMAAFAAARTELYAVARNLAKKLWPDRSLPPLDAPPKAQAALIHRVNEELSKQHPRPDDLVAAHGRSLNRMRAFIEEHDLVKLPPKETLRVLPMPAYKRGSTAAEYLAPGVLERQRTWQATYYIDPIDPRWPPARVESYLRGQNDYEVQLVAMHEAYPGHHTQYFYSKRNLDPLRAVLWNAPMVEGWAVYGEGLMVALGYGGVDNDRFRFYDLRGQMVVATNVLMDIQLESGQMSDEEALRFMVDEGFQERATAEKKLLRAKLDSTQLAQYFLGLDELRSLERDYRKRVGAGFRQRAFNEAVIGQGSIAVKFLRRILLGSEGAN